MAVQIGDVIRLSEIALQVYSFGWDPELRPSDQYASFFADFNGYASNLSILTGVVQRAQQSLEARGAGPAVHPRWHLESLLDIVGDCKATLRECEKLLEDNKRFCETTGAIRNLEFNYLVQPRVARLQERLIRHNSRLQNVLKPFEIDLLTRIHQDLARGIGEVRDHVLGVREDLRELIGILVPNLRDALELRSRRETHTVEIPPEILAELDAEFNLHPSVAAGGHPSLRDMTDSFITSFDQCTRRFAPGLTVEQKTPPIFEYISLLKCQFLMLRIRAHPALNDAAEASHWPGYVGALEEKLSEECYRFRREMAPPDTSSRTGDMLVLWPEEDPSPIFDIHSEQLLMENLMEVPLVADHESHTKRLRLLRHTGTRDRHYRMITTVHVANQRLPHRRTVDFDITRAVLNPVYASPTSENAPFEVILEENHTSHRIRFVHRQDLFLFQQALTGFQVVDDYAEYMVTASFIVRGRLMLEAASLQLWLHRRLDGELVSEDSNPESPSVDNGLLRAQTPSTLRSRRDSAMSGMSASGALHHQGASPRRGDSTNSSSASFSSAAGLSNSASQRQGLGINHLLPQIQTQTSNVIPPSPVFALHNQEPTSTLHSTNTATHSYQQTPPGRAAPFPIPSRPFSTNTASPRIYHSPTTSLSLGSSPPRPASIAASTRSSSSDHTVTTVRAISGATGSGTGHIHSQPMRPQLVLFTKNASGAHAFVVLAIDQDTEPNSERCDCRTDGGASCRITALEQRSGTRLLAAHRLAGGPWDVLPLAAKRRHEVGERGFAGADWRGLTRVSLLFRSASARAEFGGGWCECRRRNEAEEVECLRNGHVGLLGQVRVWYRRQMVVWHRGRYESHVEVVSQPRGQGRDR